MTVEICVLRCWRFLNHLDIVRRHLIAAIQLAVSCSELYFVRCFLHRSPDLLACVRRVRVRVRLGLEKYFSAQSAELNSTTSGTGSVRISSQGLFTLKVNFRPKISHRPG